VTAADDRYDVIVVGGGQAGLALGYFLARDGRRFTILDAADAPGEAWRKRWDSLKLFTPVRHDSLPGLPFPGDPDTYPGRDEVVEYLTRYAERFNLPVQFDSEVLAVRADDDGGFVIELRDRAYAADQVVIATGPFQTPRVPALAEQLDAGIVQMHSIDYRGPGDVPGAPVLVVGGGNTGYQIAEELAATHEVHLAVGSRQAPLPQRLLGRDLFRYLEAVGFMRVTVQSRLGRRLQDGETLVGSSPRAARRRHGIELRGRAVETSGTEIRFTDGSALSPKAVIWATGFQLDHSFVQAPILDENGRVEHRRGVTRVPALYFLGLPWQHTRGSALLGWVKDDAQYIASEIARAATRSSEAPAVRTTA
jgi:putative flavoprotein involved in K+ transport